jgi:uncharacterized cupin superfamily protein
LERLERLEQRFRVLCALLFSSDSPTTQFMKIVRLYTGTDNESHFEEIDVELNLRGHMEVSELQPAHGILFRRVPPTHRSNYHPAPRRQYVITLAGQVEIEIGDGTVRRFGPGDVMLAEDTTGHGHITRVIGGQPRDCIMIPLK